MDQASRINYLKKSEPNITAFRGLSNLMSAKWLEDPAFDEDANILNVARHGWQAFNVFAKLAEAEDSASSSNE